VAIDDEIDAARSQIEFDQQVTRIPTTLDLTSTPYRILRKGLSTWKPSASGSRGVDAT